MAKTESTAVNELIALVSSQTVPGEPGEDLMFSSPKPMAAARMTAPLPVIKDVAPLPRNRARGTESNPLPSVRSMTAPPTRGSTIPPLPRAAVSKPPQPTMRMAALPPPTGGFNPRTTQSRPSLPPPMRHSAQRPAEGTPAPEFARSEAPSSMPIAAPFEPRSAVAAVPVVEDQWFQTSHLVDKLDAKKFDESWGTYQVTRQASTLALVKKLIAPTAVLVLLGVCIGGFLAFNGEGGHKRHSTEPVNPAADQVAAQTDPAAATAPVATNEPAAKPAATEPAKPPVAKPEPKADEVATKPADTATKPADVATKAPVQAPTAPAPAAKAEPKAVAAVDTHGMTTIKTTRGEVKLVEIRIDSKPSGATVMLVDRGKASFLGTTPVNAAVDPSRAYDVVFTAANHATQLEHLDPNVSHHLAIALGKPGNQVVAETHHHHHDTPKAVASAPAPSAEVNAPKVSAPAVAPKAEKIDTKVAAPAPAPKVVAPAPAAAPKIVAAPAAAAAPAAPKVAALAPAAAPKVAAAPAGNGTLMVSSKPPCDIVIDGKPTGLTTPQRSIPLVPGAHKVTFVNAAESINKTVAVQITADKPTKLIQDLMKK